MRTLARRSALGTAALIVLLAGVAWWLLTTFGGRDFLLGQIAARLPAGTELRWQRAEGPVTGPMTLHGVQFVHRGCPDVDGEPVAYPNCATPLVTTFNAQQVMIDPSLRPLLGRRLVLDALALSGAVLDLPVSEEPFELPRWPESLPAINPPLELHADAFAIDDLRVTQAGEAVIAIAKARGGLRAQTGHLQLAQLQVDSDRGHFTVHGDYTPRDDYAMDLTASAVLPARAGRTPASLGLVARGDLSRLHVAVAGRAPGPVRANLTLTGKDSPRWTLRADAPRMDLGLLTDPQAAPSDTPLALNLQADGVEGRFELQGRVQQGDWSAVIQPSQVQLQDQVLLLQPLVLDTLDGRITARGRADFTEPANARYRFALNARGLQWTGTPAAGEPAPLPVQADADLGFAGTAQAWAAIGSGRLQRDGQAAGVALDARGNTAAARLHALRVRMPTGTLDATGTIAWAPALDWTAQAELARFDPGYFLPDWPGRVTGSIRSTGQRSAAGDLQADVDIPDIGGSLRGRPLDGRGKLAIQMPAQGNARYQGDVRLALGDSRVRADGRIADTLEVDADFAPLQLADLLPDGAGTLRGTVALRGARSAPDIRADLTGSGLRFGEYRADSASIQGQLPWRGSNGDLRVQARGVMAGLALDTLDVHATGAVERLQLQGDATAANTGRLALSGTLQRNGTRWNGRIAQLHLQPTTGADWRLQQAAEVGFGGGVLQLDNACLASSQGGTLCAQADWPRNGLSLRGTAVPLALANVYLTKQADGRPWLLNGTLDLQAQLRPVGKAWTGTALLRSATGGIRTGQRARNDLIGYRDLQLDASFDPQRLQATLQSGLSDGGRVEARIATGWDADAPLDGSIAVNTSELTWLELFSPDIVDPQGRLDGRISLGGTRGQPALGGQAQLSAFRTELPALNITLTDGQASLQALADGTARITGSVRSGEGTLTIAGSLGWRGDDIPLQLALTGRNVQLSDTRELQAVVDPDVRIQWQTGQPLQVTGRVTVPQADIDLERLELGVSPSDDVVVLDPVNPQDAGGPASPLAMDLTVVVGENVNLTGFGLDGQLQGQLRVRAVPGREMTGSGRLDVEGEYTAYGQDLTITDARLLWSNTPISDPLLDVRAQREIGDVVAGIHVTGRASQPQVQVHSNQSGSQTDALAWLTLGRPLSGLNGDQANQVSAASMALTAGGSMLASQLGAKLGLADAGVMQSRTAGSVFGIGAYLSPKVYVGYGVSLLGTGQVVWLKYLLRKGFDVQIESSSVENRGSVNWRKEK